MTNTVTTYNSVTRHDILKLKKLSVSSVPGDSKVTEIELQSVTQSVVKD